MMGAAGQHGEQQGFHLVGSRACRHLLGVKVAPLQDHVEHPGQRPMVLRVGVRGTLLYEYLDAGDGAMDNVWWPVYRVDRPVLEGLPDVTAKVKRRYG